MLRKLLGYKLVLVSAIMFLFNSPGLCKGHSIANFTVPYTSYTYDYWEKTVAAPQAYLPSLLLRGEDLQAGSFRDPNDLCITPAGNIYLADTGNNRVLVFDRNWDLIREITDFSIDGAQESFREPMGLYATAAEELYVADTGNARLVHFDSSGRALRIIGQPEPSLAGVLPDGFVYRPLKVGVDGHGRIYVISRDLYEGLITFSADGQFRGFVGAPKVTPKLSDYIWSRLATKEQRERIKIFLPTEYSGFDLDSQGFVYATSTDEDKDEDEGGIPVKIRKLNPKGEDLLRRLGFSDPMGDVEFPGHWSLATRRRSSTLVDVTIQDYGVYSVLDANRGRIFTYDHNGNLLYVFGYIGKDQGQVGKPTAIAHYGKSIFVLDAQGKGIIVYEPTDYALLIWAALDAYHRGDYQLTELIWGKVLALNANNDLAYTGIARTLLRRGQYGEAMHYFKLGNNRKEYSEAFELYRKEAIYSNFTTVAWALLALLALVFVGKRFIGKRRLSPSTWEAATAEGFAPADSFLRRTVQSLRFALYVILHPFDGFTKLKYEKRGTGAAATILLALLVATYVFARQYTGFIFNTADLTKLNLLVEAFSVLVPFLLWCVVNWALTTLMEGKGTFQDIYIASAFSLVPLLLTVVPLTIISNYITVEEGTFYYLLMTLGTLWAALTVILGAVMTTHEYSFQKTVFTSIFTIVGMAFALFLGFLFVSLSEQVVIFVRQIFTEIVHRT